MRNHVFTSGEAALNYLRRIIFYLTTLFFILAPLEILIYLKILKKMKSKQDRKQQNIFCVQDLFDNHDKDLNFYKGFFEENLSKKNDLYKSRFNCG